MITIGASHQSLLSRKKTRNSEASESSLLKFSPCDSLSEISGGVSSSVDLCGTIAVSGVTGFLRRFPVLIEFRRSKLRRRSFRHKGIRFSFPNLVLDRPRLASLHPP